MQIEYQECQEEGHTGCKLTHICIHPVYFPPRSRYMCDKCIHEYKNNFKEIVWEKNHFVEIQNFMLIFKDQRLTYIESRLKSQYGNIAKLNYLQKLYMEHCADDYSQELSRLKSKIEVQINQYEREIQEVQILNEVNQQFIIHGLESFNFDQLNILLGNQCDLINNEIRNFHEINAEINNIMEFSYMEFSEMKKQKLKEERTFQQDQNLREISKKLRRMNNYLEFQEYSIKGFQFIHRNSYFNSTFFSENDRYFAMIEYESNYKHNKLQIKKQNTLKITQQLNMRKFNTDAQFDPLFNYFILYNQKIFYLYKLRLKNQIKLIKKFNFEQKFLNFLLIKSFKIIILCKGQIVIKKLDFKNKCINIIQLQQKRISFCHGGERNIIALEDKKYIKIYYENETKPLLSTYVGFKVQQMQFIDNDSKLLIKQEELISICQIEEHSLTTINKIKLISGLIYRISQSNIIEIKEEEYQYVKISGLRFRISQSNIIVIKEQEQQYVKIYDKNFIFEKNFVFGGSFVNWLGDRCESTKMTKNFLIKNYKGQSQIIKRNFIREYETLVNDY